MSTTWNECRHFISYVTDFTVRGSETHVQPQTRGTISCRLSATAYSLNSQLQASSRKQLTFILVKYKKDTQVSTCFKMFIAEFPAVFENNL
jgi:hypothetical protein